MMSACFLLRFETHSGQVALSTWPCCGFKRPKLSQVLVPKKEETASGAPHDQ